MEPLAQLVKQELPVPGAHRVKLVQVGQLVQLVPLVLWGLLE